MSIKNSYDGAISRLATTESINYEITKALLRGPFPADDSCQSIRFVTDQYADVDSFIHPYWRREDDQVYIDIRGFSNVNAAGVLSVRDGEDRDMWIYRAKMELAWIRGRREDLFTAWQFSNEVFVRWLTSVIKDKYRLSPIHETRLLTCIALFSIGRYFDKIEGFRAVERYAQQIASTYRVDSDVIFEIIDLCGDVFPRNVDELIGLIHNANVSPALVDLNRLTLFNCLGGSFFMVANAVPIVSLAIEYPPAFASLVLMALKHTTIKNKTLIGQRTAMSASGGRDKHFIGAVEKVFDRYCDEVEPGRKDSYELRIGNEGVGTIAAGVAGGCILITFIAWLISNVFGGDKSPSKSSDKAVEELTKAISEMKASRELISSAYETLKSNAWPADDALEKLGDENKKIWQDLSSGVRLPGVKLAVYDFAKSGGKGSSISMGPVKYTGGDVSKFKANLSKANQWLTTNFGGTEGSEIAQAVIGALLANRPFPINDINGPEAIDALATGFGQAQDILEAIANANDINALNAILPKIQSFNTDLQTAFNKANPDATPSVVGGVQGAGGVVAANKASKNVNIQLFLPSTGDFNETFLNEQTEAVKKLVEMHSNPDSVMTMAKNNAEACKKLEALSKEYKSKTDRFNKLSEHLSGFTEDEKQSDAHKAATAFVTGKSELMTYTTDVVNSCSNTARSLQALAKMISGMIIDLKGKELQADGDKPAEPAKPEEPKPEGNTGDNK